MRASFASPLMLLGVTMCPLSSCTMSPDQQFIAEKIPVKIQGSRPLTVDLRSLSGNGWNEVGIRCKPDVWKLIAADARDFSVRLMFSDDEGTKIINVSPGTGKLWPVDSYHYLFSLGGKRGARATVQMTFPGTLTGTLNAEVIVLKTPADTGP